MKQITRTGTVIGRVKNWCGTAQYMAPTVMKAAEFLRVHERFDDATVLYELALQALADDRLFERLNLEEALALTPGYPPALLHLAEACEASGKMDCAKESYQRFLRAHPPYEDSAARAKAALAELGSP